MIKFNGFILFIGMSFLCSLISASKLEVIIKSYEALEYREIVDRQNAKYSFSFCLCVKESTHPHNDPSCQCQINKQGKTAKESSPKAIYSASCLHNPEDDKCLYSGFAYHKQKYLYVKVTLGQAILTRPEWQSLMPSKKKKIAYLAAQTQKKKIRLEYLASEVDGQPEVARPSEPPVTKPIKAPKMTHFYPKSSVQTTVRPTTFSPARQTVTTTAAPSQIYHYHDMPQGQNIQSLNDAKKFLLRLLKIQKIPPLSFDTQGFKRAMLTVHNKFRYMHGVNLLSNDAVAESAAQSWANTLAQRQGCLAHEHRRGFGENLFYFAADYLTDPNSMAEAVVRTFYSEGKGYDYRRFKRNNYGVGHFTQMIWKSTTKMGVGVAIKHFNGRRTNGCQPRRPGYTLYIVVKYNPAGNVQSSNEFLTNVRPVMRRM